MIKTIKEILEEKRRKKNLGNIAYEFQDYGVRLAEALNDLRRKSFYIKLAKEQTRSVLEAAKEYALGYTKARSKAKIFMWFLKEKGILEAKSDSKLRLKHGPKSEN